MNPLGELKKAISTNAPLQMAAAGTVRKAGLAKRPICLTTPERGYDINTLQELLSHKDVKTTMICTHVIKRGGKGVKGPMHDLQRRNDGVLYGNHVAPFPQGSMLSNGL
jgi:hypothetical protein